jgi:hypothetical protein
MIDVIVFSKNRPLQLYALLESMLSFTDAGQVAQVSVIYSYDDEYSSALDEVKKKFEGITFIKQTNFKRDVATALFASTNDFCTFLVDDIVFKNTISLGNIVELLKNNPGLLTYSMRMGLHLNFCYPTDKIQPIPDGSIISQTFVWNWTNAQGDWSYPLSLDGHVFKKSDVMTWTSKINFNNPNQLEDFMQHAKTQGLSQHCACHVFSSIVNMPINRVQNEYANRCGEVDPSKLLEVWSSGKKIDIGHTFKIINESAHYPVNIKIVDRE